MRDLHEWPDYRKKSKRHTGDQPKRRAGQFWPIPCALDIQSAGYYVQFWSNCGSDGFAYRKNQRLGDLVAGTTVVRTDSRSNINETIFVETVQAYQPLYPQVTILHENDISLIKEVLNRHYKMHNLVLLQKTADKIKSVLSLQTDHEAEDFLRTVIKDYNHLTAQASIDKFSVKLCVIFVKLCVTSDLLHRVSQRSHRASQRMTVQIRIFNIQRSIFNIQVRTQNHSNHFYE